MPLQEIVAPWDQQPQEWAEVDRSGIGRGVQMLLMQQGGRLVDLVNPHIQWTPFNGATSAVTSAGIASSFNGTASRVFRGSGYAEMGGANGTYFVWMPRFGSYDVSGSILLSTTDASLYLQITAGGSVFVTGASATGAPNISNTRDKSIVFSSKSALTDVFFDGRRVAANINNRVLQVGTKNFNFGGYTSGTDWDVDADIVIAGYTSESWGEAEAQAFHANPWQLFVRREWVPMAAASGGGVTGTSSGTLQLAGSAAGSVLVSGASAGTLAISGTSTAAVRVTGASTGTLSLSGTATGTVGATGVTGQSSQTLSLTGTSTGTVGISGQSAQTLALSGTAAGSVRVSGASAGTLSLTGTATGNTTGAVTGASAGVLSLSGSATGTVRVSGGSAAVLQITGNAGAQIVVRGVSAGVLSMTGSATANNGEPEPLAIRASLSSRTRIRTDGAGARPAQRSTASRPRQ